MKSRMLVFWGVSVLAVAFIYQQNFIHNFVKVGKPYIPGRWQPEVFETYQSDTAAHASAMVQQVRQQGPRRLLMPMPNYRLDQQNTYYPTCLGLQAKVVGLFWMVTRSDVDDCIASAQAWLCFFTGLALAMLCLKVVKEFGWVTGGVFLMLTMSSDWLVFVGRHLGHVFVTCLAPFVLAWWGFRKDGPKEAVSSRLLIMIGCLVSVRAMCSYEYITNVILAATVPPFYYLLLNQAHPKAYVAAIGKICLAGAAGVLVAMVLHLLQSTWAFGSLEQGAKILQDIAFARSYGTNDVERSAMAGVPLLRIIDAYLFQNALSIPFVGYRQTVFLTIGAACAVTMGLSLAAFTWCSSVGDNEYGKAGNDHRRGFALAVTTLWAMCCTFTWPLLMKGHMFHHLHMAPKLFYVPFLLTYYILIGFLIQQAIPRLLNSFSSLLRKSTAER